MNRAGVAASLVCLATVFALSALCQYDPPPVQNLQAEMLKAIKERTEQLGKELTRLRTLGVKDPFLADVEIFHKAALWIVNHNEFYHKDSGKWALAVLERGLLRAAQLARGESPWLGQTGHSVARAYRSTVDGSVQPYAVTFPTDFGKVPSRKWRLDVVLHGRNASLTEVSFLYQHSSEKPAPKDLDHVQIDIFGRGNNAYRWAGESDVNEAVDGFLAVERFLNRATLYDPARFVLRGFSMGGAGTWHMGLHRPDRWCVIGPGAGFTETHGYIASLPAKLPLYQEACLSIYDAIDYAENAANVPVVAYAGSDDKQLQAARNIEERLKPLHIPMTLLIAPGLGHAFPPEWQKKAEAEYARQAAKGRETYPKKVRFVTWTLKYPACDWVTILGLEQHYRKAIVEAEAGDDSFTVKTSNVRALDLRLPSGATRQPMKVSIDGMDVETRPQEDPSGILRLYLEKRGGRWAGVLAERLIADRQRQAQKTSGLQGPIDDAFMGGFLCVRGTGQPWHETTAHYAEANLKRFQAEWAKYLRGELPVKDDRDVTPEDIAGKHLILFGDPASNSLIAQVVTGLPLQWTRDKITWNGKGYAAGEHVPVLIYPSPLNLNLYVVLNTGHTFHAEAFKGTNALLYPRLGDYALLRLTAHDKDPLAMEVIDAGVFDEFWKMPAQP